MVLGMKIAVSRRMYRFILREMQNALLLLLEKLLFMRIARDYRGIAGQAHNNNLPPLGEGKRDPPSEGWMRQGIRSSILFAGSGQ